MLSAIHSRESDGDVPVPGSGDVDDIHVIALAEVFEVVVVLVVEAW